uniref:Uncharacterized protein n=1 Tax=Cuerna arida TaxID=1464854 RepID=A0A1B6EHL6_9HEMI
MEVLVEMINASTAQARIQSHETPRWWGRWKRARIIVVDGAPHLENTSNAEDSWSESLERVIQRVAPQLPTLSATTRKAIVCTIALVLVWRLVLWALELIVTGICCIVAVLGLLCFLRPDIGLMLLTQVPPHLQTARLWLVQALISAGNAIDETTPRNQHRSIHASPPEATTESPSTSCC